MQWFQRQKASKALMYAMALHTLVKKDTNEEKVKIYMQCKKKLLYSIS